MWASPLWLPGLQRAHPRAGAGQPAGRPGRTRRELERRGRLTTRRCSANWRLDLLVFSTHDPWRRWRGCSSSPSILDSSTGKLGRDPRRRSLPAQRQRRVKRSPRYKALRSHRIPITTAGRQLPAEDQANAMTVEDLLANGTRQRSHGRTSDGPGSWRIPMAKFTTNFLVLRARILALYGRWREAQTELEAAFPAHAIRTARTRSRWSYYRARALRLY